MTTATDKKQIVILGGGFGGVYSALHLERLLDPAEHDLILLSRDNYFLMTPLLFEAGSGVLEPRHAVNPIRPLLSWARFIEADIEEVDFDGRVVYGRHGPSARPYEIPYDELVIALGGVTNRSLIPGSYQARAFKTLADAIALRNHIIDMFERADVEPQRERRSELLTFTVIGAGLVGVELMGELTEFVHNLCRTYTRLPQEACRFVLIEAGPAVLGEMDRDLAGYAVKELTGRRVEILTSTPVEAIARDGVTLADGRRIPGHTIVLAAGVGPNPLLAGFALAKDRKGRLVVDAHMRAAERPQVWALGDCAAIPDPQGHPYPPLAQHALRQAKVLAENLDAAIHGRPTRPFVYTSKGTLASLGSFSGVGTLSLAPGRTLKLRGFLAWWVWRTYYLLQMPRFDRKLRVMVDWTVALFFRNDVVKLDLTKGLGAPNSTGHQADSEDPRRL